MYTLPIATAIAAVLFITISKVKRIPRKRLYINAVLIVFIAFALCYDAIEPITLGFILLAVAFLYIVITNSHYDKLHSENEDTLRRATVLVANLEAALIRMEALNFPKQEIEAVAHSYDVALRLKVKYRIELENTARTVTIDDGDDDDGDIQDN